MQCLYITFLLVIMWLRLFGVCRVLYAQTFRDVSEAVGFPRTHKISSWAAVWADYDNDGDLDVLTIGHLGPQTGSITQLWRNDLEAKTFMDVTVRAGLNPDNGDCHGPIWADFDNDGHVDLFISKGSAKIHPWSVKNYNELWRNDGNGTFTNIAEAAGVIGIGHRGRGAYGVDFDRDGWLDIYLLSWRIAEVNLGNALFRQHGNMVFTDVAEAVGVYRPGQATHKQRYQAPGNRVGAWADFNNDGAPDLLIMQPLALFANRGDGTFVEVPQGAGIAAAPYAASAAWGDYDNDGYLDVYITMQTNNRGLLYHNNGDGTFTDVTAASGLINKAEAWAVVWGDYDNDGYLDLYIVNKLNRKEPNRLFRNGGNGTFTDVTAKAGVAVQVHGKGIDASFVDYNNDGFLDLFITNGSGRQTGPFVLLENTGNANHWIDIQLEGQQSNRGGIMTKVTVTTSLGVQYQEHHGPTHHLGQSHTPLHFGLGPTTRIENIELVWPSGIRQRLEQLEVDQRIRIVEPASSPEVSLGLSSRRANTVGTE